MEGRESGGVSGDACSTSTPPSVAAVAGSRSRQFFQVKQVETSNSALLNLAFYSFLIFTLPIGIFFFVKQLLTDIGLDPVYVTVGPAIAAVVGVNLVVVLYVISAIKQEAREKEALKPKQS